MPSYRIENATRGPRGFRRGNRQHFLRPGETVTVELSDDDLRQFQNSRSFNVDEVGRKSSKREEPKPTSLVASHKGGGKYVVHRGEEEVAANLTKEEAENFNKLSDSDKEKQLASWEKKES